MPDFGIFRGFNDKLFGNKLYAGQLPTQLGLIGSLDFGIDPDAQAFFDRVTTAGGTLSAIEKTAVNQLVVDMKSYSIWTKMKAIYPMVGASSAACAQNLKSSSFTGTFSSGWTFASTGVTPNGTSAYMNTNLNPVTESIKESFGIYSRTTETGVKIPIGTREEQGSKQNYIGNAFSTINIRGTSGTSTGTSPTTKGFICVYDSDDSINQYTNLNGVKNNGTRTFNGSPNSVFYIGAWNNGGTAAFFSNIQLAFCFIGNRITDTEASNLYTVVQAFQTKLSRNV